MSVANDWPDYTPADYCELVGANPLTDKTACINAVAQAAGAEYMNDGGEEEKPDGETSTHKAR